MAWVCKANRYFNYYKTPDHEKLSMAYFHMDGEALVWFKNAKDIGLFDSWDAFVQELQVKFGSTACDNPVKATIQETPILVSNPMFIGVNQTHVPPNGFVHVIKNEDADLPHTHAHVPPNGLIHVIKNEDVDLPHILVEGQILLLSGCHKAKELDVSFLGDSCGVNDRFHSRNDHNFYKKMFYIDLWCW